MEQVFFLLYNIFKLTDPFVRQFHTGGICRTSPETPRSVSIREARPTVGVRRCRFDWKWFLENKAKKKNMLHVIPKFWLMYIGIVHFLLFPPLKTFTKHLHNDYLIKINTLLLR